MSYSKCLLVFKEWLYHPFKKIILDIMNDISQLENYQNRNEEKEMIIIKFTDTVILLLKRKLIRMVKVFLFKIY